MPAYWSAKGYVRRACGRKITYGEQATKDYENRHLYGSMSGADRWHWKETARKLAAKQRAKERRERAKRKRAERKAAKAKPKEGS